MKQSSKEPVFLLEMPHSLRHLIMKRGLMLRGRRTRTLCCMSKGGSKAWLEAKLIANPGEVAEENWDKAHELAGKFKNQLHADVYVEPAGEYGRFKELTAPPTPPEFDTPDAFASHGAAVDFGFSESMAPGLLSGFGAGPGIGHNSRQSDPFAMAGMNIPGMPHIPDPMKDLLPPQVRQAMAGNSTARSDNGKRAELIFPALRELPGWSELPESKQKMFEVEAAQLHSSGHFSPDHDLSMASVLQADPAGATLDSERALAALSVHPKISAALKRFMLESFEAATARHGGADCT